MIRKGYGFPSIFNADSVVEEQLRQGKTLEDARAGGCSGCVETGAFGKEAYILTGYFNLVKILELALHDGVDPRTGQAAGAADRRARRASATFDELFAAFRRQLHHFIEIKIRGNQLIERMYAARMPAPFLSRDHRRLHRQGQGLQRRRRPLQQHLHPIGGHRQPHRQPGGDPKQLVFDEPDAVAGRPGRGVGRRFRRARSRCASGCSTRRHKYGNDDDYADQIMVRAFSALLRGDRRAAQRQGRAVPRGDAAHHLPRLFRRGDRGHAGRPPGRPAACPRASRPCRAPTAAGPTAVIKSAAKMDHVKTGGTLLNMKFSPSLAGRRGRTSTSWPTWCGPTSSWTATTCSSTWSARETLREAQAQPERTAT